MGFLKVSAAQAREFAMRRYVDVLLCEALRFNAIKSEHLPMVGVSRWLPHSDETRPGQGSELRFPGGFSELVFLDEVIMSENEKSVDPLFEKRAIELAETLPTGVQARQAVVQIGTTEYVIVMGERHSQALNRMLLDEFDLTLKAKA